MDTGWTLAVPLGYKEKTIDREVAQTVEQGPREAVDSLFLDIWVRVGNVGKKRKEHTLVLLRNIL